MYVGCVDCGCKLSDLPKNQRTERPRFTRKDLSGWKDTISCCRKCLNIWLKKHPEYKGLKRK